MTTTAAASPGASADNEALRLDRYIVRVDDGLNARAIAHEHTQKLGVRVGHVYRTAIDGYSAQVPAAAITALNADPRVSSAARPPGPHHRADHADRDQPRRR